VTLSDSGGKSVFPATRAPEHVAEGLGEDRQLRNPGQGRGSAKDRSVVVPGGCTWAQVQKAEIRGSWLKASWDK
jgi:hypothetical protein